ncbi:hypothetical protein [Streptomyces sp. NPDC057199]|uniref:hypothetical protein n=1 Tax=Streptomyces sp. NPDC057199 TaxID=3346047 RepID=UPI00363939FF
MPYPLTTAEADGHHRLDTVPMWLEAVWNDELDAELTLERFTEHWRYGLGPS